MLLKFVHKLQEIGVALVQLFQHLLNWMLIDRSATDRSPLQSQANQKLVPLHCGMEAANESVNGGKVIVEDTSTHGSSIKLLHIGNFLLLSGSHGAAIATTAASTRARARASASGSAAQRRRCNNDEGGSESMDCDSHSRDGDSNGSANEAEGGGKSGAVNEADFGAGGAEAAVELELELGEATAHVVQIGGVGVVRGREGVVVEVELKKDVQGPTALGLAEAEVEAQ